MDTMTIEDAAKALGVSRNTAYAAAARGEIPAIRIGRRLLVPKVQLDRLLEGEAPPGRRSGLRVALRHDRDGGITGTS